MKKRCVRCKERFDLSVFAIINQTTKQQDRYCKECRRQIRRDWYQRYKPRIRAQLKANAKRYHTDYTQWKSTLVCSICNEDDTCCIDLHHMDPSTKEHGISNMSKGWTLQRIKEEAKKCIVVCSNCHRKIHKYGLEIILQKFNKQYLVSNSASSCQNGYGMTS